MLAVLAEFERYFRRNRRRMKYATMARRHLPIGSGASALLLHPPAAGRVEVAARARLREDDLSCRFRLLSPRGRVR
jgi:hypothetical protein